MITGAQIRMARGYSKLSVRGLAELADVAESTIKRMEAVDGVPASSGTNLAKVEAALRGVGLEFLEGGDIASGIGVTLEPDT